MTTQVTAATLATLPFDDAERFGDRPAQMFKRDGSWQSLSFTRLAGVSDDIARGLIALGVDPGSRVALICETRAEWMQAAYGIAAAGCTVVPVYATNSAEECEWVLRDSGAVAVLCEDAGQITKINRIRDDLPELAHVLSIDPVEGYPDLAALRELGRGHGNEEERRRRTGSVTADDLAVIIYTSGTTGKPKGCMISHGNLMACVQQKIDFGIIGPEDSSYLFLPLAHVFAQTANIASHAVGCVVSYASAGTAAIFSDLAEVRPTYFPSVPRIYEKVYAAFAGAPRTEEVFAKVRAAFGGNLRIAISGAAPIGVEILEFFHRAGVPIFEGYGLTESTSYGTVNLPDALRLGSIGRPMPFGEVRIADDGEIQLRGPHIFTGYWNDRAATEAAMTDDGWLMTGDLGSVDEDGFVWITGRKKEIIITAGGKNLNPSELENELRQSPFVSYAVMHGDRRPYPVALVTLDMEYARQWAAAQGLPTDASSLTSLPAIRASIQATLDEANSRHAPVAQIKRFVILDHDFSQETGELTPTMKMKRSVINDKYAKVLDDLYGQG
ncbi:AMP-dependent synthetase/ligase [Streptomyces somaliensis]|uniref:AMP-dependent synthetase/ligase n=1 Tax=Streptomyces somaliensis TaxID=78355 RepID=UPI0020CF7E7E|nr:AMP-dependent synthetase/ligase [Streptomyces somaliensis]MCP9946658.1 AMP-dependent synthetase/ligase [Streptomyces somaliensis]MCP9960211.1 AMP-dependent synthetase/ligase [Streptomyces somaliensis]MCP9963401.1 AMP-dependent synthetase/ligase [Streptomyces somaliensis]MCP9972971.1 AMP-dependent synthetase/ligase [Streptomyces somaliensis]